MPKKPVKKITATSAAASDDSSAKIDAVQAQKPASKPKKTPAKKAEPAAKVSAKPTASKAAAKPAAKPAKKKRAPAKTRTAKVPVHDEAGLVVELAVPVGPAVSDPIGGVIDGEAHAAIEPNAPHTSSEDRAPSEGKAMARAFVEEIHADELPEFPHDDANDSESTPQTKLDARADAKLERLQKILSQAGVASRRHAEEMIVAGRVVVNGQLVTQLGAKADPERDHIRVDGKLIAGAERHRYFVLNKPRGYVTSASDPEGRPTVMQFFDKLHERLYPVGRLDYQSEGLLLVTNDGELANQLTRAASGVEKTYVVKVAGQPTDEELDRLRSGVSIEHGARGSQRVDTSPTQVREIRHGDNPWFEVVLIEGRNRELRKMFEQIGHHVEKIRRVGYGPLVLDVEPGTFRELTPEEVTALRLTAEGKLKPRRPRASQMLPKDAGKPAEEREAKRSPQRPFTRQTDRQTRPPRYDAKPDFKPRFESDRPKRIESSRPDRFGGAKREGFGGGKRESFGGPKREGFDSRPPRFAGDRKEPFGEKPGRFASPKPDRFGGPKREGFAGRPERSSSDRTERSGDKPNRFAGPRRENFSGPKREGFGSRPPRFAGERTERSGDRPERFGGRPQSSSSYRGERGGSRPFSPRPSQSRPDPRRDESDRRPAFKPAERPAFDQGSKLTITPDDRAPVNREERPAFKPNRPREQRPDSRREQRPGDRPQKPWATKTGERGPNESTSRPPARRFSSGPPSARSSSSRGSGKPAFRPGGKSTFRPGGKSGPGRGSHPSSRPGSRPGNRKRT